MIGPGDYDDSDNDYSVYEDSDGNVHYDGPSNGE